MYHPTPLVRYADPAFSQERTRHCRLRLQVSEHELCLAVYDSLADTFPLIERYPIRKGYAQLRPQEALARILQTHALTRLEFQSVEVILVTPAYTLVPGALFDADQAGNLLALSHPVKKDEEIGWGRFEAQDLYFIYAWPASWKQVLEAQFPNARIRHYAAVLAAGLLPDALGQTVVFVHVQDFREDIVVIADGKLLLFNSFNFQSPEDFLYFILLTFDRLSLNRELVPLRLLGEVEEGSAIFASCYKYIRDVAFVPRRSASSVPDPEGETDALPAHFYFNLLHNSDEDY